jgi:putative phosphoesterase
MLRPEALAALAGSDHLVHAGDIGAAEIVERLRAIAPLTVVRGNNDRAAWAAAIPDTAHVEIAGVAILVIHDIGDLAIDPRAHAIDVVVCGHSHRPRCECRDGVWFVNPGSAGPRRFSLPVCVGELAIRGGCATPRIIELSIGSHR